MLGASHRSAGQKRVKCYYCPSFLPHLVTFYVKLKVGQNECPEGEISGDLNRSGDLLFNPKVDPFGGCLLAKEGFSLEEVRAWWSVKEKGAGEPWFAYGWRFV